MLATLPPELSIKVCTYLGLSSAAALGSTCRYFHDISLPLLYRTVVLHKERQALLFMQTMSQCVDERLTCQVLSLTITNRLDPPIGPRVLSRDLQTLIPEGLRRMRRLQHYKGLSFNYGLLNPDVASALFSLTSLTSVQALLPQSYSTGPVINLVIPPTLRPNLPNLVSLELDSYICGATLHSSYIPFFRHLICNHATQLNRLLLHPPQDDGTPFLEYLPISTSLPSLEALALRGPSFSSTLARQCPNIRTLEFTSPVNDTTVIPFDEFPYLESVTASSPEVISQFFRSNGSSRRIRRLQIGLSYDIVEFVHQDWGCIVPSLVAIDTMDIGLRELCIHAHSVDISLLLDVTRCLPSLEVLAVYRLYQMNVSATYSESNGRN
ncbi:hypothetical protein K474DRAFT_1769014 [Panus rudis PR-1116 ss-1]|nr:hypothetical protein K474DRAFT_1769014 [Panus rudis PR-1116 ss-1]